MAPKLSNLRLAALIWGFAILLSRLVGLIRETVIGRSLGSGAEADIYFAAFIIPDFLNYLLAGGALSLVFIPIFQEHLSRGDEGAAWKSASVIGCFILLLSSLTTLLLWWQAPKLAPWIAPGIEGAQRETLVELIRILLPAQIFHLSGGLLSAILQARDQHLLPALSPVVYTGGIIAGACS